MKNVENNILHYQMISETVHVLVRQSLALKKSVERHLFFGGNSADITHTIQELDTFYKGLSFYEALEIKIDNHELNYYQLTDLLNILLREFDHFHILVQNLLGYFSSGQAIAIHRKPVEIIRLLQEVVDLFEYLAEERFIEVRFHIEGDPILKVDRELLRRMVINLLDNAIKYSFAGTEKTGKRFILIEGRRHSTNNDWIFIFKSYGVGIDKDEIDSGSIFQYGTRGKFSGDRGRSGTGIGLAEAKRIAEAHSGKLAIESRKLDEDVYLTYVEVILPIH